MNFFTVFSLLNGFLNIMLGIFVASNKINKLDNLFFFLFTVSIFIWNIGYGLMYIWPNVITGMYFAKLGTIGIIFIPFFANLFVVNILGKKEKYLTPFLLICVAALLYILFSNGFYTKVSSYYWGNYPIANCFNFLNILFFVIIFAKVCFQLFDNIRFNVAEKNKLQYLLIAFGIGFFGFIDWIPNYFNQFYPLAFFLSSSWVFIIAIAITKTRLMDISVVISRTVAYGLVGTFYVLIMRELYSFVTIST